MSLPILYSFRRCPYAMRARLAITASQTQVELREILLRDKAPEFLNASPKGTVPVLVASDGEVLEQSLDIMFWALGRSDPDGWLDLDSEAMKSADALIAAADDEFKANLDRYKYASRFVGVEPVLARTEASNFLTDLDQRLKGSTFLMGAQPSIADHAIAPFVRQFANVDRAWFDAQPWPNLLRWLTEFLHSDLFNGIMTKYPKWHVGDPVTQFPNEAAHAS